MKSGRSGALKPSRRGLSCKANNISDAGTGDLGVLTTHETSQWLCPGEAGSNRPGWMPLQVQVSAFSFVSKLSGFARYLCIKQFQKWLQYSHNNFNIRYWAKELDFDFTDLFECVSSLTAQIFDNLKDNNVFSISHFSNDVWRLRYAIFVSESQWDMHLSNIYIARLGCHRDPSMYSPMPEDSTWATHISPSLLFCLSRAYVKTKKLWTMKNLYWVYKTLG